MPQPNLYTEVAADDWPEQVGAAVHRLLARPKRQRPLILGLTGSVAVGKSTFAATLAAILSGVSPPLDVAVIATDGFLYPNAELERRGMLERKGFPETFDIPGLLRFLDKVRNGHPEARAPLYSHDWYDIVPGDEQVINRSEIVVIEGLHLLAPSPKKDFLDFTIYLDADEADLEAWYIERFLAQRAGAIDRPDSYFHRYAALDQHEAVNNARQLWATVNAVNLREHILPTRDHADLILKKGPDHQIRRAQLRRS